MKFSDNPAKSSPPGQPVTWRRTGDDLGASPQAPGLIGQLGETPLPGYELLTDAAPLPIDPELLRGVRPSFSPATQALADELNEHRRAQIEAVPRAHF